MWEFRFDINPVAASRPRVTRDGHTYYAGPYKEFRKEMDQILEERFGDFDPQTAPLSVEINCYITKPKTTKLWTPRADVDNYAKAILDSFNGKLWEDDRQITDLRVTKAWTESHEHLGYFDIKLDYDWENYEQDENGTWQLIRYRA